MLEVDIKKKLGDFTLDVAFQSENEVMALLGASGCGKSVTLKCIAGVMTPDEGEIVLNGRVLFHKKKRINLPPQKRNIGFLFQNYALFPNMTVEQNIRCGVRDKVNVNDRVLTKIKAMQLENLEGHYPAQISGGQQQRTALARILVGEPELLLLDEPFAALDSYLRWQVELELVDTLREEMLSAVFVSHSRDEVYRICDSVSVMDKGKGQPKITKKQLFENPDTVAACLLSGCKNVSRARKIGEKRVVCEDWGGIELVSEGTVDVGINHAGVRSHYFKLAEEPGENIFSGKIVKVIDDTFSTVLIVNVNKSSSTIRVEWDKNPKWDKKLGQEILIKIDPHDLMLLR